jgi:hypothetical protein
VEQLRIKCKIKSKKKVDSCANYSYLGRLIYP